MVRKNIRFIDVVNIFPPISLFETVSSTMNAQLFLRTIAIHVLDATSQKTPKNQHLTFGVRGKIRNSA